MDTIQLLVTLNEAYLPRLQVLLTSIYQNNPGEKFAIYLMHRGLTNKHLESVQRQCGRFCYDLVPVFVGETLFQGAPVSKQYPQEMYYRMLASHLLPETLDRILYIDPDTLVINPLRPLWETNLQGCLFAAAAHSGKTELVNSVNRGAVRDRPRLL